MVGVVYGSTERHARLISWHSDKSILQRLPFIQNLPQETDLSKYEIYVETALGKIFPELEYSAEGALTPDIVLISREEKSTFIGEAKSGDVRLTYDRYAKASRDRKKALTPLSDQGYTIVFFGLFPNRIIVGHNRHREEFEPFHDPDDMYKGTLVNGPELPRLQKYLARKYHPSLVQRIYSSLLASSIGNAHPI